MSLMMDLETLQTMWREDAAMDLDNLHEEAIKTPSLHAKYHEIYNKFYLLKKKAEQDERNLKLQKFEFYTGRAEPEAYVEAYQKKIVDKSHLEVVLGADSDLAKMRLKLDHYTAILEYLKDVLKVIHQRSFNIRAAIDFQKFTAGF
jgi:transcriptional accessory protein Tex/SPT6